MVRPSRVLPPRNRARNGEGVTLWVTGGVPGTGKP